MQSLVSVWISFVMLFVSFVPGFVPPEDKSGPVDRTYPYVFVHGLFGWGRDEGINGDLPYWGATSCDLIKNITEEGYECYAASVGPFSSNWDRACELYAQLTGNVVDYGEAHAKEHGHARFGRTYSEPMIKNWGEVGEDGLVNKINLVGHSFGGNTVRLLLALLDQGAPEEMRMSGNKVSSLFTGGKSNWVNSLTAICSPNNGSSLYYWGEILNVTDLIFAVAFMWAGIWGNSKINGYFDFHLEQFGLTNVPGQKPTTASRLMALYKVMHAEYDNVAYDLSPDGCKVMNDRIDISDDVYYFSYAFNTTEQIPYIHNQIAIPSTLVILRPFAYMMGMYFHNIVSDIPIDKTWLPNDGLVSVASAKYPFDEPHKDYDPDSIEQGVWNVMPLSTGDHGNAIGIGVSEEQTMEFYNGIIGMIESLPITG